IKPTMNLPKGGLPDPKTRFEVITTVSRALQLLNFLRTQKYVAVDIETTGFDTFRDRILSIGFCWDDGKAAIIPEEVLEDSTVRLNLESLFESESTEFIFHNGKF